MFYVHGVCTMEPLIMKFNPQNMNPHNIDDNTHVKQQSLLTTSVKTNENRLYVFSLQQLLVQYRISPLHYSSIR